jgi:hypothetical protein
MPDKKEDKSKKMIAFFLSIIIIVAFGIIVYINLPQETPNNQGNGGSKNDQEKVTLSVILGDEQIDYTLEDLEDLEAYKESGGYIKTGWLPEVNIEVPHNYTGVRIITLLDEIDELPGNYSITVEASDDYTRDFNMSLILGNVDIYNETGNITSVGDVTMLLAYQGEETYLNESLGGPLRIVYVDNGAITDSSLWIKNVVSIEITPI